MIEKAWDNIPEGLSSKGKANLVSDFVSIGIDEDSALSECRKISFVSKNCHRAPLIWTIKHRLQLLLRVHVIMDCMISGYTTSSSLLPLYLNKCKHRAANYSLD